MTLYIKTGCSFCARVLAVLDMHSIPYETKNVSDPAVVEEMIQLGGKKREPFLVDGDTMMYESEAIISYLEQKYVPGNTPVKPKIYYAKDTEVCPL